MEYVYDFLKGYNDLIVLGAFGGIVLLFVLYYMIRHLIKGIGRTARTLNRMSVIMEGMPVDDPGMYQALDKAKKDRVMRRLWQKIYVAFCCKQNAQARHIISYKAISALSGFSSSMVIISVLGVVTAAAMYCCGYEPVRMYYVLVIGVLGALVILWMNCLVRSYAKKAVFTFRADLEVISLCETRDDGTEKVLDFLEEKLDKLISLKRNEQTPGFVKSSGKDLEIQIIESIIAACLKRLENSSGERFERLNAALDRSVAAQSELVDKINIFLSQH